MRALLLLIALLLLPSGCGSDETSNMSGDGKYRPAASGERTTEALACNALVDAHSQRMLTLGCAGTSRTCPGLLRAQFTESCLEYDQGSVDGCLAYYAMQDTCPDLLGAIDDCVITAYEGSTPSGCP